MIKKTLFFLLLLKFQIQFAQKITYQIPDSLKNKEYKYLDDKSFELKNDSTKAAIYLYAYLNKALKEKNWKEAVYGYQNIVHQSSNNSKLIYADSMIYIAKKSHDYALIGSAYLSKGIVYYGLKQQNYALDNYIIANNYISKTDDNYLIYKVKYHIALIKYYLGFYDEAISLLRECVTYFKNDNPRAYLNSLHSLGFCYNKVGNYGLCTETNDLGVAETERLGIKEMTCYFDHSEGINQFYKSNYKIALTKIISTLREISSNKDFANESIGNFYIGKSYLALNKKDLALPYFQKVDQIFEDKNYLRPDLRENYELLIHYYKTKNNYKMQLYYIDQLLKADKVLNETFTYLISKIHKEYDTKALLTEKQLIQNQLNRRKYFDYILVFLISFLIVCLVVVTYRHYKTRREYKVRFDELMQNASNKNYIKTKSKVERPEILDINQESINTILKQLDKFESDQKYLEKELNLSKVAVQFKTNPNYLSKIISYYRDKGFVEYINDLKIDYVVQLLKDDPKTRNYTNKALAEEAGFSSTQRFANAFFAKTNISTNYFIDQIKKE